MLSGPWLYLVAIAAAFAIATLARMSGAMLLLPFVVSVLGTHPHHRRTLTHRRRSRHTPLVAMVSALALVLGLNWHHRVLNRRHGTLLLLCYPAFVVAVVLTT